MVVVINVTVMTLAYLVGDMIGRLPNIYGASV